MAELESNEAIIHTPPLSPETKSLVGMEGAELVTVKDYDAAGRASEITIPLPKTSDFNTWTLMQQAVMLKRGVWKAASVADIVWGLAYARQIGADVVKGDLFPTGEGRWGTSNKYKIRQAIASGNVAGIEVAMKDLTDPVNLPGCVRNKDLECTVTIHVKGWDKPITRVARLSRWYKATNPNWKGNPEHMLELNTVAHACEYVPGANLGATEEDEAPPPTPPLMSFDAETVPKQVIQVIGGAGMSQIHTRRMP